MKIEMMNFVNPQDFYALAASLFFLWTAVSILLGMLYGMPAMAFSMLIAICIPIVFALLASIGVVIQFIIHCYVYLKKQQYN